MRLNQRVSIILDFNISKTHPFFFSNFVFAVPFIDATPVESLTPLAGVGLYLKTQLGYGGFIAPKLIVFDSSLYMTSINNYELV